jgi:hypothetical protein
MVEIMLSTSFCAVPALRRVEPLITSGPVMISIGCSARRAIGEDGLHTNPTVNASSARACSTAPST